MEFEVFEIENKRNESRVRVSNNMLVYNAIANREIIKDSNYVVYYTSKDKVGFRFTKEKEDNAIRIAKRKSEATVTSKTIIKELFAKEELPKSYKIKLDKEKQIYYIEK